MRRRRDDERGSRAGRAARRSAGLCRLAGRGASERHGFMPPA